MFPRVTSALQLKTRLIALSFAEKQPDVPGLDLRGRATFEIEADAARQAGPSCRRFSSDPVSCPNPGRRHLP